MSHTYNANDDGVNESNDSGQFQSSCYELRYFLGGRLSYLAHHHLARLFPCYLH